MHTGDRVVALTLPLIEHKAASPRVPSSRSHRSGNIGASPSALRKIVGAPSFKDQHRLVFLCIR